MNQKRLHFSDTNRHKTLALMRLFALMTLCMLLVASRDAFTRGVSPAPAKAPPPTWPNDGAIDHPVASTGCAAMSPVQPGMTAKQTIAVNPTTNEGYSTREYWIHVPQGYSPSRPTPLVLVFHGGGGTAIGMEAATGWSAFADTHNLLVVYPQGLPYSALGQGFTTWAATGPLDTFVNGVDDLLFVSNLLDALQRLYCVAPQRIYATGFSAGGAMTAFLTCGLTGRIAAFAPMSGDAYQFKGGCFPQHPTSILEFHGSADHGEQYAGFPAREDPDWRRMGVLEWLTAWAQRDGCAARPTRFFDQSPAIGEQWPGCKHGFMIAHYLVMGLGHTMPPPLAGRSAVEMIWDFFQAHPLQSN